MTDRGAKKRPAGGRAAPSRTRSSRSPASLESLHRRVVACRLCPRLVSHREEVGRVKRRAYEDETYWARPVPGFGDAGARLLLVGLAPGAHGSNRTGRMFTGDASGDFLFPALHRARFATQEDATRRGDGLALIGCYITAVARCAPPDNKPAPGEIENCRPFLQAELDLLPRVRVILALGQIAFQGTLAALAERGVGLPRPRPAFAHGVASEVGPYVLLASYHPSRQNTNTGRLTAAMFDDVLRKARSLLS